MCPTEWGLILMALTNARAIGIGIKTNSKIAKIEGLKGN